MPKPPVSRPILVLLVVCAVGLGLATMLGWGFTEVYEAVTDGNGIAGFDHPVLEAMVASRTPAMASAVTWFTMTAGQVAMPIWATVVALVLVRVSRRWTPLILLLVAGAGSLALTIVLKNLVARARPPLAEAVPPYESSASFPSGHSLNALVVAGIIIYCLLRVQRRQWVRVLTAVGGGLYIALIGLSRVYLGHHWLSDVIGAWLLGLSWLAVVVVGHRIARAYALRKHPAEAATV